MKLRFRKDRNEVIKLNSDYYNTKLQKLIEEASKDGITLHDNKFEQTEDEKFPVMEVFFVNNSTCEDSGRYHIYKRTVKISQDDYGRIVAYAKENNYKKLKFNCSNGDDCIEDIFYNNDESGMDFSSLSVGGDITIVHNSYHVYTDNDECVDLFLTKEDDNNDFPRGYISFYMMESSDFAKAENVNMRLKKFMRDNFSRKE